ncbi:MAG TPA: right-handed parallel beta-helix repeat-containing protein [Thermoleophilaceae bacterium]
MRAKLAIAAGLGLALASAAPAMAVDYPPPKNPGGVSKPPTGPHHTLRVGKHEQYKTIQSAVKAAKAGDMIRVAHGTYREGVKITGSAKRYLKLIGDPRHPDKVVIEAKKAQNGVFINGANQITVQGFQAQHYKANGFFAVNVTGYKFDRLIATDGGVYGVYAFNSKGGTISNSTASWNNDSGFYIGQTPRQTKPIRSVVKNITSYGNVLGWSGTNMRYVTITKSRFFNNGTGIVPNALDSEKFPPPEDNVISNNEVFWNNFDYYKGAPFKLRPPATGDVPYPTGVGILLFGGRGNTIQSNRVYGNWGVGVGMLQQFLLKQKDAQDLKNNQVKNNQFGLNGTDLNGRDLFYDGNGSGNCFSGNTGVQVTLPEDGSTFVNCPFSGNNTFNQQAQTTAIGFAVAPDQETSWIQHPHAAKKGYNALVRWKKGKDIWGGP